MGLIAQKSGLKPTLDVEYVSLSDENFASKYINFKKNITQTKQEIVDKKIPPKGGIFFMAIYFTN